jgi:hypothetical protein
MGIDRTLLALAVVSACAACASAPADNPASAPKANVVARCDEVKTGTRLPRCDSADGVKQVSGGDYRTGANASGGLGTRPGE